METLCSSAREDITPAPGIEMSGYVARRQPSTGVHDPLFARALCVRKGERRLLWLHADVIAFEGADVQRLKSELEAAHGLPPEEVMVTATHTHSGPAVVRLNRCGAYNAGEVRRIFDAFHRLAARVLRDAEPVNLEAGEGMCALGVHRRPSDRPHTDQRLPVLGFRRASGEYVAVIALYAMHNVAMGGENTLFSADVAGRAAARLSDSLPGNPEVLWLNGACGNVNPPSVAGDFERVERWGDELSAAARAALESAVPVPARMRCARTVLTLAPRTPDASEVDAEVRARAGRPIPAGPDAWVHEASREAVMDWATAMRSGDPELAARRRAPAEIQVVRLGRWCWVGIPGEPFSVLNEELREAAGRDVVVVGYANGDVGYLCPEDACEKGGYEPDGAFIYYGTNPLPRGAYESAREAATALLRVLPA